MSTIQNKKSKFRSSGVWKVFRKRIALKQNSLDPITNKKLLKGYNCHHMDLNENNYTDLTNEDNFVCLNKNTHKIVHELYRYYKTDEEVLDRLKTTLDKMKKLNSKELNK